jgi:methylaspartate ammonia-lyase
MSNEIAASPIHVIVDELPIYMAAKPLAIWLGVGEKEIERCLNKAVDPLPHLIIGTHKKIDRKEALKYFKKYEVGHSI